MSIVDKKTKLTSKEKKLLKKQQLKEENEKFLERKKLIKAPYEVDDLIESVPLFKSYTKNGLDVKLSIVHACKTSRDLFTWCFEMVKTNMQHFYENSWGWSDSAKRSELREDESLFLIAFAKDENGEYNKAVAFCTFRFEDDGEKDAPITYLYEIQLSEEVRRKGLGKWMVQAIELLSLKYKMEHLMLTVFKENDAAINFYAGLRYTIDPTSPSVANPTEEESYEILSKSFKRR